MKQLVIIGAGGFGREVLGWARGCKAYRREWELRGFLDDREDALASYAACGVPIIGNTRDYQPRSDDVFICGMGQPVLRAQMRARFLAMGGVFTRVIHESCILGRGVELGTGVVLCPSVVLTCDLYVGDNTAFNIGAAMGHDARIGADCQVSSYCDITGFVTIGNQVLMGSRATVIPGKRVGDRSVVGAGSVVVRDVPADVTVFGNPARVLSRR